LIAGRLADHDRVTGFEARTQDMAIPGPRFIKTITMNAALCLALMLIAAALAFAVGRYYILNAVTSSVPPHHPRPQIEVR